jgi:FMN phosphatase YigB (HAD superfamily)
MIRICLDIGNVLVYSNFEKFINKLSKTLNITNEEVNYFLNRSQKLHDLGCTHMVDELRDHFKIRSQGILEELIFYWNEVINPCSFIFDIINEVSKEDKIEIALLSNIGIEHSKQIEMLGLCSETGHLFKNAIKYFSCQVGARKPALLYYHLFLQLHPEFKGAAYIDDLHENLEVSKQFGFQTFHFALDSLHNVSDQQLAAKTKEIKEFFLSCQIN